MSAPPIHVLVFEDNPGDAHLIRVALSESTQAFRVHTVDRVGACPDALEPFEAILLDLDLPDSAGLETVRRVRERAPHIPIVVLTGHSGDLGRQAVQEGAQDYLVKGNVEGPLLERSILYGIERKRTERQLYEAQEALRRSQKMEAVGRLASGIAHDFNNLLTAIRGNAQLLLDQAPPGPNGLAELAEIDRSARRAGELTRQLLAFARREVIQPEVIEADARVGELAQMFRRLISTSIELNLDLGAGTPAVFMDGSQFDQVVLNLVVNARDAIEDRGDIRIATRVEGQPGHQWYVLTVADSGVGMSAEIVDRIFEPFFTTKSVGEGTGLGLSTTYGIVTDAGGSIEVDSAQGVGSTFTVRLPVHTNSAAVGGADKDPARSASASDIPGQGGEHTILVVDDEGAVRRAVARILERSGFSVIQAESGAEAVELAAGADSLDLVVTDMVMPGMTGAELAEELGAHFSSLPVLIMSGYTADETVRRGIEAGVVEFLQKPFESQDLLQAVRTLLELPLH